MGSQAPRSVRWTLAVLLVAAAAAAGIAANVLLLGISREGNSDPVGHFRPQLGLATATSAREVKSVPRAKVRPAEKRSWSAGGTTSPSGFGGGRTTVPEHEPSESDDD
jgi:hypothetical protein